MSFVTHSDIHAHNTFQQRDVVVPQTKTLALNAGGLVVEAPPASVIALNITLA